MNRKATGAIAGGLAVLFTPIFVFLLLLGGPDCGPAGTGNLTKVAKDEIPARVLPMYIAAAKRWDIDLAFLASIGAQETEHGTNGATYDLNYAGCIGLMQLGTGGACGDFWGSNKCDGNGDGVMSVIDDWDNICAAAHGLRKDKGAPPAGGSYDGYYRAACGYYGACSDANANYAPEVMARAERYGFVPGNKTDTGKLEEHVVGGAVPVSTDATTPTDTSVLNLGDSLAVGTDAPLSEALKGRTVRTIATTGISTARGLRSLEAHTDLPKTWVISLGTNDANVAAFRTSVKAIKTLAGERKASLYWVNIARKPLGGVTDEDLNGVLTAELAPEQIINWKALVAAGKVTLSDQIHPSAAGYKERAKLVSDALSATANTPVAATDSQCAGGTGGGSLSGGSTDAKALAANKNITFQSPSQKTDLTSGKVSPRQVALLAGIASKYRITITAMATDHAPGTNHEAGRGTDIAIVNDDNCAPPDQSGDCWKLAQELDRIDGCMHPTELIYYFDPGPSPDSFARADHDDHIHVGYDGPLGPHHYSETDPCGPKSLTGD